MWYAGLCHLFVLEYSSSSQGTYLIQRNLLDSPFYACFIARKALELQKCCLALCFFEQRKVYRAPSPTVGGEVLPFHVALILHAPEGRGYQPSPYHHSQLQAQLLAVVKKALLQTACHHNHIHRCGLNSTHLGDLLSNFQQWNHQPACMYQEHVVESLSQVRAETPVVEQGYQLIIHRNPPLCWSLSLRVAAHLSYLKHHLSSFLLRPTDIKQPDLLFPPWRHSQAFSISRIAIALWKKKSVSGEKQAMQSPVPHFL